MNTPRRQPASLPLLAALVLALAIAASPLPTAPASAAGEGASAWSEAHASRARLLAGGSRDGERVAGLEIALDPGFRTYWRHAGDSGLPPDFDWSGSTNVAAVEPLFPAPERFSDGTGAYFGYADHVILPLRVTPVDAAEPFELRLTLDYGVCKEICIPARAELALAVDARSQPLEGPVAEALARTPKPVAVGADGPLAILGVDVAGPDRLTVRVRAPQEATLFAEGPNHRWFLDPQAAMSEAEEGEGVFAVAIAARPREVAEPASLRFTLVAPDGAVEATHALDPAALASGP